MAAPILIYGSKKLMPTERFKELNNDDNSMHLGSRTSFQVIRAKLLSKRQNI